MYWRSNEVPREVQRVKPTENQIAQQICDYLRLHGWNVHRIEADLRGPKARVKREEPGTPDYIAVRIATGIASFVRSYDVVYIEVKRPGGRLRRSQQIWIEDARKRGWTVVVASSIDDLVAARMCSCGGWFPVADPSAAMEKCPICGEA